MSLVCLPLEQKIYTQHDGKTLCITSGLLNHSNQYKQNDEIMVLLDAKWFLNFCQCQLQSQMSLLKIREVTFKLTVNLNEVNGYFLRTPLKKKTHKKCLKSEFAFQFPNHHRSKKSFLEFFLQINF